MFLKRLEIQGFKSFPEKIRLDFKQGITGVVGPNGSGKSNISDAIRWVLGEQKAKTLRGDKMEDIIFAGTKNRKPLGFAEVTIYLDNTDKKLPLEYTEIAITRKVYRSGESGYYINSTACRLKDIYELFMDTGIGKEGYSIIGQGKIDAILSSKSDDRRQLFEEAVGIIKFKNRKIEAENKLEDIRKNLIRTNDIIYELEQQIGPLFKQKEKAKDFLKISEKLKGIQITLFILEYENAEKDKRDIFKNIEALKNTILSLEKEKDNFIKNQEDLKKCILGKEVNIEEINKSILNVNVDIEQNQNNINLDRQNINFILDNINRFKNEQQKNNDNILKKGDEISLIKSSKEAKILEYNLKKEELDTYLIRFDEISYKMDKNKEEFKQINDKVVEKIQLSSKISNKLTFFKTSKDNLKDKLNNIDQDICLLNSKIKEKTIRKMVFDKNLLEIKESERDISQNIDVYNIDFEKIKIQLYDIKQKNEEDNKKYIDLKNRYKILDELAKDYEGYFTSVKSILKEKNDVLSGVCGVIGELISVPDKYEIAIEIALGSAIQNIVTKTEEDAKIAIRYLKENKKGRATFLPISDIKPKSLGKEQKDILKEKGVIGVADSLIKFNSEYKSIMSNILGKTIIVDNISNAINFAKKYKYIYKVVTLDGELLHIGGALTGGSISKKTGGIFSRDREIKDISNRLLIFEQNINKNNLVIKEKEKALSNIQNDIEKSREKLNNISLDKIKLNVDIKQINEYISDLENSLKINYKEKENIIEKLEQSYFDSDVLEEELLSVNKEIEDLKKYISIFEDKIEEEKQDKDISFIYINKLKMEIKDIEYYIKNSDKDIDRLNKEISILKDHNISLNKNIQENEEKLISLNKNIQDIQKNICFLKESNFTLKNKRYTKKYLFFKRK